MKATQFEFRFRIVIAVLFYIFGFWAPWTRFGAVAPDTTAWLALSALMARWKWLPLDEATLLVTSLAILATFAGALLRIWGTAYLGPAVVHATDMQAAEITADGPYRYVRNPLYLGTWLFAVGVSILMPPSGAVFFLLATLVFYIRLILGEEDFLSRTLGAPYLEYKQKVGRVVPSLRARVSSVRTKPHWLDGVMAESYGAAFASCLAVLAWDYNPQLLIRCLLVCFGISLVSRAFLPKRQLGAA